MWQQYFKTYYADSNYPDELARQPTYNSPGRSKGQQQRSNAQEGQMTPTTATKQTNRSFGFNDFQTGHFFNRISIYQLARQRFFEYTLINPIIQSWQGPQLNSSSSNPAENQMTLIYEGIKYAEGNITRSQPDGFAQLHYDTTPSPLSLMGGGTASLFGSTGVLAGGLDVFGDIAGIASGQVTNPFAIIGTAIKAKNTLDNAKQLTKDGIRNEIVNVAVGATLNTVEQTVRIEGLNKVNQTKATPVEGDNQVVSDPKLIQNQVDNDAQSTVITGEGEAPVPVTT
jgi:hypothetical protein